MSVHYIPLNSQYTLGYCHDRKVETIAVQRRYGEKYHYYFDHPSGQFKDLECLECQPTVTEQHLYPLYAKHCAIIKNFVIFSYNRLSAKVEQYVFDKETGGLEQVHRPDVVRNTASELEDVVCAIKDPESLILIQRDELKNFKKMKYNESTYGFNRLPAVPVKTLLMKRTEFEMDPENEITFQQDEFLERLHSFYIQYCPNTNQNVVCVLRKSGDYSRFVVNDHTEEFNHVICDECTRAVTERSLYPLYSVYCDILEQNVIFVKNLVNFRVEQYVFSPETMSFEQVFNPSIRYNHEKVTESENIFTKIFDAKIIKIARGEGGCIEKLMLSELGRMERFEERPVVTIKIKKEDERVLGKISLENGVKLLEKQNNQTGTFPFDPSTLDDHSIPSTLASSFDLMTASQGSSGLDVDDYDRCSDLADGLMNMGI